LGGSPLLLNIGVIMKVIANEDMYVSTTWGAAIRLYAGVEKELGDDLGLACLQQGAVRVEDESIPRNPSLMAREEVIEEAELVEEEDARDIEDTENKEQAEVSGETETEEAVREEKLESAIQQIIDNGDPKDFTTDGMPKQSVIKAVFGEQVSSEERDEVWAKLIVD